MRRFGRAWLAVAVAVLWLGAGPAAGAAAQPSTWNFQQADVPAAQALGNYGRGVLVAVVDTWVDPTQPQLAGRVTNVDCLSGTCQAGYYKDSCPHGTHVAGTIASTGYGVAPEARILSVQVLTDNTPDQGQPDPNASCGGNDPAIVAGINYAADHGAQVINLSFGPDVPLSLSGGPESAAIMNAAQAAAAKGIVVVFAAGNSALPTVGSGNEYFVVAATGPSGQLASYSNFNMLTGSVNIAAPGGDSATNACSVADCILSTFPDNELGLLQGTSMAAPHVSGLAALLISQYPKRGLSDVISTVEGTARPLTGAGSGLIDGARALKAEAAAHPPAQTSPSSNPSPTSSPASGSAATGGSGGGSPAPNSPTGGQAVPVGVAGAGTIRPGAGPTVVTLPKAAPTSTLAPKEGGTVSVAGAGPAPAASGLSAHRATSWAGHHSGILVFACVLLAADLLALLWTREARRLFGR